MLRSYGDSIDLTVYRCIQESLTNAIRHGRNKSRAVCIPDIASEGLIADAGASVDLRRRQAWMLDSCRGE